MTSKTRRRRLFSRRAWLNVSTRKRAHMIGHVSYDTWTGRDGDRRANVDGLLVISDCTRSVELDFDVYDESGVEEMREKVRRTRAFVLQFCAAMDSALDMVEGAS